MPHTHFVCAVIYRRGEKKRVELLVINYRARGGQAQVKFPGGTNTECPGELLETTLVREILEETGLSVNVDRAVQIWENQVSEEHTKNGYLVNLDDCRGRLRTEPIEDESDQLEPPRWEPASTLGRTLYLSHRGPYLAALEELGLPRPQV